MNISVEVNGTTYSDDVEPRLLLVHFLRENCKLTGTNVGCDTSTVLAGQVGCTSVAAGINVSSAAAHSCSRCPELCRGGT